jgi:hypothetical protein
MANLRLVRKNIYPDTIFLQLKNISALGAISSSFFKVPSDTAITMRAYGHQANKLEWLVTPREAICGFYCEFDTLATGSVTRQLDKFTTTPLTLEY